MDESQDTAAFTATLGPSRADYVRQIFSEARETLARSRGDNYQSWEREEPLGVPERRSRERPLASRDRTQPITPAARPDTQVPTWAEERAAVLEAIRNVGWGTRADLEAIRGLRELCEALDDRFAQLQKGPWHSVFRAMKTWSDAECAHWEESLQQPPYGV